MGLKKECLSFPTVKHYHFNLLLAVTIAAAVNGYPTVCKDGWFGNDCNHKCHCTGACDRIIGCTTQCSPGWFGSKCQFKTSDLRVGKELEQENIDGGPYECWENWRDGTFVRLKNPHLFSWLRARFVSSDNKESLKVQFWVQEREVCKDAFQLPNRDDYVDLFCSTEDAITKIYVSGLSSAGDVCTIHISQGMNLALYATAEQSSTSGDLSADKAIDGEIPIDLEANSTNQELTCSQTLEQKDLSSWTLTFEHPVDVVAIKIHAMKDFQNSKCCDLRGFVIDFADDTGVIHSYINTNNHSLDVYEVYFPTRIPHFTQMTIFPRSESLKLSLCEVEVLGEPICEPGFTGPQCKELCNCDLGYTCISSQGLCPEGRGLTCPKGKYGPTCEEICNCDGDSCLSDGTCPTRCPDSYKGEDCRTLIRTTCTRPDRFGQFCEHYCQCKGGCDPEGNCPEGCLNGWFGPSCQYKISEAIIKVDGRTIEGNGESHDCLDQPQTQVELRLIKPHFFKWLRIRTKRFASSDVMRELTVRFQLVDGTEVCPFPYFLTPDDEFMDVHCAIDGPLENITISGGADSFKHLCSVHVSQGCNYALYSLATQSSTFGSMRATHAIDGDIAIADNLTDQERTCSHTNRQADPPTWVLNLPLAVDAVKINIYNRVNHKIACCEKRLQGFTIQLSHGFETVYNYTDTNPEPQDVYEIVFSERISPFQEMTIRAREGSDALNLCEVEVIGEASCIQGFYGILCDKECNCQFREPCVASTGVCPTGCRNGYTGIGCKSACGNFYYGENCEHDCRRKSHCKFVWGSRTCDERRGKCLHGCSHDMAMPYCNMKNCIDGKFGHNCKYKCRCSEQHTCSSVDGQCVPKPGVKLTIDEPCIPGWFGPGCLYKLVGFKSVGENGTVPDWLSDYDRFTCRSASEDEKASMELYLEYPIYARWIRLIVRHFEDSSNLKMRLVSTDGASTYECDKGRIPASRIIYDYICPTTKPVNKMLFDGSLAKALCSVYVVAGRCLHTMKMPMMQPRYDIHLRDKGHLLLVQVAQNKDECKAGERFKVTGMIASSSRLLGTSSTAPERDGVFTFLSDLKTSAQYITITSESGNVLSICEVEFLGVLQCPSGFFGVNCDEKCHCKTENISCLDNGACPGGCAAGYKDENCHTRCPDGYYGFQCGDKCSSFCVGNSRFCSRVGGDCTFGCEDGLLPPLCKKACPNGYWGPQCKFRCGEHCKGQLVCNKADGTCPNGCKPGYLEPLCTFTCMDTFYGQDCNQPCRESCKDMICHHITGKCLDCKTGYYGETCEACPPKFYGTHCMKLCSTRCLNESCNAATGRCDKCNPGYKGRFCNEECPIGMFGQDCKNECSDYCRGGKTQCNKVDGACRKGCLNNLLPPDCMKKFKKNKKELEPSNIGDDLIRYALMFAALLIVIAIVERYQLSETQRKTRKGNESAVQGRTAQLNALWAEQEYPFLMPSEDEEQNDLLPPSSSSSAASSKGTFSAGELQKMMDPGEKAAAIPISASSISKGGRRSRHSSLLKNNVGVKADIVKKVTSKLDSVKP